MLWTADTDVALAEGTAEAGSTADADEADRPRAPGDRPRCDLGDAVELERAWRVVEAVLVSSRLGAIMAHCARMKANAVACDTRLSQMTKPAPFAAFSIHSKNHIALRSVSTAMGL